MEGSPPYQETQAYVKRVLKYLSKYQKGKAAYDPLFGEPVMLKSLNQIIKWYPSINCFFKDGHLVTFPIQK